MRIWLLLLLLSCGGEALAPDAADARRAAVGSNHPASGPFSQVKGGGSWGPGAHFAAGEGSNLKVGAYSAHATRMLLEVYTGATGADAKYDYWMQQGADHIWRAQVARVPGKTMYAFRAWGPNWPFDAGWKRGGSTAGFLADVDAAGNRFDPNKVLIDPYARELSHDRSATGQPAEIFASGPRRDVDTGRWAPKSIALADSTPTGARPHLRAGDAVIYEAHVRGLTRHPSASRLHAIAGALPGFAAVSDVPAALRGTYAGAARMAPYLRALGFNTVEFLPVQEADNDGNPAGRSGGNYWGYMTYGYFAPDRRYAADQGPGGPTREFKQMVAAFHDAGLEVYLDVVYNHTGEGGTWDAARTTAEVTGLRGLDNASYYALAGDNSAYFDSTGCGNNLDGAQPAVQRLIGDSLAFWAGEMGVDGFRFDEAAELGRGPAPSRAFDPQAKLLADIAAFARAQDVEIVAEPWDIGTVQIGNFPAGWSEWNGRYRDAVRRYGKGDASGADGTSWADAFYGAWRSGPQHSVNFITSHDGFTLADLVSYGAKTNATEPWPFGPSDGGSDQNDSWDWGGDPALRRQAIRNFVAFQALSRGVPMLVAGDEFGRTQNGNNNAYDVDSVGIASNYGFIASDHPQAAPTGDTGEPYRDSLGADARPNGLNDQFLFVRSMLQLRQAHPALRHADSGVPISFAHADGSPGFDSRFDLMGRILVSGSAAGDADFLVLSNMYWGSGAFTLPPGRWVRVADTAAWAEPEGNFWDAGAAIAGNYVVNPRSLVVLMAAP